MVIAQVKSSQGHGGCPLGSLAGQLAETDAQARALIAAGIWTVVGRHQRRAAPSSRRRAPPRTAPTRTTSSPSPSSPHFKAACILAQVQRDTRPLETAVDTVLELARLSCRDVPADGDTWNSVPADP